MTLGGRGKRDCATTDITTVTHSGVQARHKHDGNILIVLDDNLTFHSPKHPSGKSIFLLHPLAPEIVAGIAQTYYRLQARSQHLRNMSLASRGIRFTRLAPAIRRAYLPQIQLTPFLDRSSTCSYHHTAPKMSFSNANTGSKDADPYTTKNASDPSLKEKVEDLKTFVDRNKFCLLTTKNTSGLLVSRAMALAAKVSFTEAAHLHLHLQLNLGNVTPCSSET